MFICDIDNLLISDEGATKLTIHLIKNTTGEKIILTRCSGNLSQFSDNDLNIKFVRIPIKNRSLLSVSFIIRYLYYILMTIIITLRTSPDVVYYIPFRYPRPLAQLHAFILANFSRDFKEILYHKPKINMVFKLFTRFEIGTLSRSTALELENIGFRAFYFPISYKTPCRLYNKSELRKKYGIKDSAYIILHVGHATIPRGVDVFDMLANYIPDTDKVLIVFSSWHENSKSSIKTLINNNKIIIFDEFIEDIYEIYSIADVYIFPIRDTVSAIDIPLSILEASNMGLPIIASDVENVKNLVNDYTCSNIHLIKIASPSEMAKDILNIIFNLKNAPEECLAISSNGECI